jgi:hypothetical protein
MVLSSLLHPSLTTNEFFSFHGNGIPIISTAGEGIDHHRQLVLCHPLYSFLHIISCTSSTTLCEGLPPHSVSPSSAAGTSQTKAVHDRTNDEDCSVCLYTGMGVCTGLSLYFVKLATDEKGTTKPKNRRFFYVCSVGWAVAGAYRWYLG